jgi:hypothetical protein
MRIATPQDQARRDAMAQHRSGEPDHADRDVIEPRLAGLVVERHPHLGRLLGPDVVDRECRQPIGMLQVLVRLPSRCTIALVCACNSSPTVSSLPTSSAPPAITTTTRPSSGSADEARALRDKILSISAHVIVLKNSATFAEYRDVLSTVKNIDDVVAAEPFIFLEVLIASAGHTPFGVALKGVDPQRVAGVVDMGAVMKAGKIQDLSRGEPPAIILGNTLANTLQVHIGDRVTLSLPPDTQPTVQPPHEYPFFVTGIIHTGFDEYDERLALASLVATQQIVARGDQVMGVELKVKDVDRSDKIARAIERALGGPPYEVMDWYELNRNLFGGHRP